MQIYFALSLKFFSKNILKTFVYEDMKNIWVILYGWKVSKSFHTVCQRTHPTLNKFIRYSSETFFMDYERTSFTSNNCQAAGLYVSQVYLWMWKVRKKANVRNKLWNIFDIFLYCSVWKQYFSHKICIFSVNDAEM